VATGESGRHRQAFVSMLDLLNHNNDTVVGRSRDIGRRRSLRQRLRLSSLLSSADFQPTGLPESALLFVRKLSDPSPELLGLSERRWSLMPEWEAQGTRFTR
jgi:hypothetical protein